MSWVNGLIDEVIVEVCCVAVSGACFQTSELCIVTNTSAHVMSDSDDGSELSQQSVTTPRDDTSKPTESIVDAKTRLSNWFVANFLNMRLHSSNLICRKHRQGL